MMRMENRRDQREAKVRGCSAVRSSKLSKTKCDPPPTIRAEVTTACKLTFPILVSKLQHHEIIKGDFAITGNEGPQCFGIVYLSRYSVRL